MFRHITIIGVLAALLAGHCPMSAQESTSTWMGHVGTEGANADGIEEEDPHCPGPYPYTFCDGNGDLITKCSSKPNSEPGLKPFKRAVYQCIQLFNLPTVEMEYVGTGGGDNVIVMNPSQTQSSALSAFNKWNAICPPVTGTDCCLQVIFSSNPNDFQDLGTNLESITGYYQFQYFPSTCQAECVSLPGDKNNAIYVNNTNQWLFHKVNPTPGEAVINSFFTGSAVPSVYGDAVSFDETILRLLGDYIFATSYAEDQSSPCPSPSSSVLGSQVEANTPPRSLSPEDKCRFCVLYCPNNCSLVPGEQDPLVLYLQGRPNPSSRLTTIAFSLPKSSMAELSIFDQQGNLVDTPIHGMLSDGLHEVNIDVRQLPSGTYWYVLRTDYSTQRRSMVIER